MSIALPIKYERVRKANIAIKSHMALYINNIPNNNMLEHIIVIAFRPNLARHIGGSLLVYSNYT
jgi:hypothetical protein